VNVEEAVMSDEEIQLRDVRLNEADVKTVLERATRLEGRRNTLSVAELSSVATEAGISEEAVMQAVLEILEERRVARGTERTTPLPPAPVSEPVAEREPMRRPESALMSFVRSAASVAVGALSGMIANAGDGAAMFSVGLLIIISAFRAFHHRTYGTQRSFQLELVSAWAGFVAGFGLVDGGIEEDVIGVSATTWFISAMWGGLIVASKKMRRWRIFNLARPDAGAPAAK
jgi:hypothetical protein